MPAAGTGTRMDSATPKQYLPLAGRPVILHTLERLCQCAAVQGVIVGLSIDDEHWRGLQPEFEAQEKFRGVFVGGVERADTVLNGLQALSQFADADDWVLVHDAARPSVRASDIDKLIHAVIGQHADGGLLALPVTDTVKRADTQQRVRETVVRDDLWRALTPQLFPIAALTQALEQALERGITVTDEASAMEHSGARPLLVQGHSDNIKITLPGDLALAQLFMQQQQESH